MYQRELKLEAEEKAITIIHLKNVLSSCNMPGDEETKRMDIGCSHYLRAFDIR